MTTDNTVQVVIEDITYELRTRLPWMEQRRIDDLGWRMFVDGRELSRHSDFSEIESVEIATDSAKQDQARLVARLVGVNRREIPNLKPAHVAILLDKIVELETEEAAEVDALKQGNPTETPSEP